MSSTPTTRTYTPLATSEQLDALLAESFQRPIVIFKHSPTCGTSAMAFDELSDLPGADDVEVHLLDVLHSRPLSQALATRVGVRHESPQVLVLKDGAVHWHGSHWRVTADAVRAALRG